MFDTDTGQDLGAASVAPATSEAVEPRARRRWINRWRDVIAAEPELPGVWRRRDGGYHVRVRVKDPRTGKLREINQQLPDHAKAREAFAWLQSESEKIRNAGAAAAPEGPPQFHVHAAQVFKTKLELGKIRSAGCRGKWRSVLKRHLIPTFGDYFVDQLQPVVKAWQSQIAAKIAAGKMTPATANTILGILRQITDAAVEEYDLPRDPLRGIEAFDSREYSTYTEEEPNSLAPPDVPRFLAKLLELHPKHYAFVLLGFATGLRPSSLRPLRRSGPDADIKWDESILLVRRSHTRKAEVMETTKTNRHQRLHLPAPLVAVLKSHADGLKRKMKTSELLFPSGRGGFRSTSCLDAPFEEVATAIGLPYRFTPRGMRRTFQDLARAAGIHDVVTRAISGHATEEMQRRYSTARDLEVREAVASVVELATAGAKVIDLSDARRALRNRAA